MPKKYLHKHGFTLIELLVVIGIIAILSAIGLVVYTSVMQQGRDSKRKSDLLSLQSALEQYYNDQSFYPYKQKGGLLTTNGLDDLLIDTSLGGLTNAIGNPSTPTSAKTYINTVPLDPFASNPRYKYVTIPSSAACDNSSANKCTNYCLYASMENPASASMPTACVTDKGSYNFAVTQP